MRKELLFFSALALAIAGCSNHDEVENIGDPGSNPLLTENSVSFTNNTTLTIGGDVKSRMGLADFTRVLTASSVNEACELDMAEEPTEIPENAIIVEDELTIDNDNKYDGASIYVKPSAKLTVNSDIAKIASITVLKGGQMTFSGKGIDGVSLLCYGDLRITSDDVVIAKDASVKVANDFSVNGSLQLKDGELYVGGILKCVALDVDHTASWHKNTALHVIGNLIQDGSADRYKDYVKFGGGAVACVEGSLVAYNVSMERECNVHVDCKLSVEMELNINSSVLNAGYIDMSEKSSFAILGDKATINLPAGGVADFADIDIDGNGINLGIVGTGNAFLHCINFRMKSDKTVFDIHPDYYLSYSSFYVGNAPDNAYRLVGPGKAVDAKDIEIETDLINVEGVKINVPEDDEVCNPGFTEPGTDPDPEPEPEPDDDKIVIEIPDDIEDDWFLKADDFAIRINGQYQEDIKIKDGIESLDGIKITEENLTVTVSGIGNLDAGTDYTYEVWLWVSEETWMSFSDSQKAAWVSGDGNGTDITDICKVTAPSGYVVRQNVYKGLSGHADTPYIKVSIHVTKEEDK